MKYGAILVLLVAALLATGCAETQKALRYTEEGQSRVWPEPPDKARFRYVGELTGEDNFKDLNPESAGSKLRGFLKAVVGLGQDRHKDVLQRPQAGVVDSTGRILVTDAGRQAVFVFDEANGRLSVWERAMADANFASPIGIAIAGNGDVLVADSEHGRVFRLNAKGKPLSSFGFRDLQRPTGLAINPSNQHVYVADTAEHNIKVFDETGKLIKIIGKIGSKPGEFNAPTHLAFRDGRLYVTDTFNARIQVLDENGEFLMSVGERGLFVGNLVRPKGVTVDSEGNIYAIESFHDHLLVYSPDAQFLLPIGGTGSGIGQFYLPAGAWSDKRDRIYVADMFNGRVVIFQYIPEYK